MYDIANSAFILLATSILPIYFNGLAESAGVSDSDYLSYWAFAAALVTLVMMVLGPFLGSLSDKRGWRKPIFVATVLIGALSCVAMGIPTWWVAFLLVYMISKIAFNASLVIYDGMIQDVTTDDRIDAVSSKGYAAGYIGSCIPFAACLVFVVLSDMMSEDSPLTFGTAVIISLAITGAWWVVMSLPLFRSYEQENYNDEESVSVKGKLTIFLDTLKEILSNPSLLMFLIAFFFYIDGVNTVIELAIAYGEALDLDSVGLLGAMLLMQVVAFPSTLVMNRFASRYGAHRVIAACVCGYIVISVFSILLTTIQGFFILAVCVGFFQGSIQALSRSYYARMIPKDRSGEYFGIMDVFGKGATILGTMVIAVLTIASSDIRMLGYVLLSMFVLGLIFFIQSCRIRVYGESPACPDRDGVSDDFEQ